MKGGKNPDGNYPQKGIGAKTLRERVDEISGDQSMREIRRKIRGRGDVLVGGFFSFLGLNFPYEKVRGNLITYTKQG